VQQTLKQSNVLSSPGAVNEYLQFWLRDKPYEIFAVLFLDSQNRLIKAQEMFRGTVTQTAVYPREVVKLALHLNACAVVLAHNHPSGCAEPSRADMHLTDALKQALAIVDIQVCDHVIVAGPTNYSFAANGTL
jgi:DNA repair protein RadC